MQPPPLGSPRRVRQNPARARYDRDSLYAVLDACLVGHVAFVHAGAPVSIPTAIARLDEFLYLHGSRSSRMFKTMAAGEQLAVSACIVDGLVKARSAFHCSLNYRSAVVFGRGSSVAEDEKAALLDQLTLALIPGTAQAYRPHLAKELKAVELIRLPLDEASVKIRVGGPIDDNEDLSLPHWAGVIPIHREYGEPVAAENLRNDIKPPATLTEHLRSRWAAQA